MSILQTTDLKKYYTRSRISRRRRTAARRTKNLWTKSCACCLGGRLDYMPNDLSGRQRAAIARALASRSAIALAGEPTALSILGMEK